MGNKIVNADEMDQPSEQKIGREEVNEMEFQEGSHHKLE